MKVAQIYLLPKPFTSKAYTIKTYNVFLFLQTESMFINQDPGTYLKSMAHSNSTKQQSTIFIV